jgi:hypothetical protein
MKKRLNIDAIANELKGGSAFFPDYKPEESPVPIEVVNKKTETKSDIPVDVIPRNHDTTIPRNHDTMTPSNKVDSLELIRREVKQFGKEAATHRFTAREKAELKDIEYTYQRQGIKTSENEITRIAINFILDDYKVNGQISILAKLLTLLHS